MHPLLPRGRDNPIQTKKNQYDSFSAHAGQRELLDWAQQRDYQNELRYARMQVNAKLHKGYGWFYISQFCAQQGIKKELQQQLLEELDIDWFEVATQAYRKKYADKPIADYQDKLKRMRYLQSRGFGSDTIQLVFAELKEE